MMGRLGERAVVVTGAARGIGACTARLLNQRGAIVIGIDRDPPEDDRVFAHFIRGDLGDVAGVRGAWTEAAQHGPVHGLVNNAAIALVAPFLDATLDDLDATYAVNLRALFLMTQLAARAMIDGEVHGAIVNLASVNGERGVSGTAAYSATKGAVAALTRCVAVELAPYGIRCNAVAPAPTATRRVLSVLSDEQIDVRSRRIPLRRLAAPDEIADAVAFLLSDGAHFMTGVTLPVDGGYLAYGS